MKPSERGAGHLFDRTSGYAWPADLAADIAEQTGCDELLEACKQLLRTGCWFVNARESHKKAVRHAEQAIAKHAPPPKPAPKLRATATEVTVTDGIASIEEDAYTLRIEGKIAGGIVVRKKYRDEIIRRLTTPAEGETG